MIARARRIWKRPPLACPRIELIEPRHEAAVLSVDNSRRYIDFVVPDHRARRSAPSSLGNLGALCPLVLRRIVDEYIGHRLFVWIYAGHGCRDINSAIVYNWLKMMDLQGWLSALSP